MPNAWTNDNAALGHASAFRCASSSDVLYLADDLPRIGEDFEKTGRIVVGKAGRASARLMRQRDLADFAVEWMEKNRIAPS